MNSEKQWYMVYTHKEAELKTLHALKKKGIECFCLLHSSVPKERHKQITKPLLPHYLFVHISPDQQAIVRQVAGVVNFMYWLNDYVVVKEEDIFILKELTKNCQLLTAGKIKVNTALPSVKEWIMAPVKNHTGTEEEDLINVSFPAYGFSVSAKESKMNVRVINMNTHRSLKKIAGI